MKLLAYLLSLAPLFASAQTKPFVPTEYEYPKSMLSSPKTYVYKNSVTGQLAYKDVSRKDTGASVIITWKQYGPSSPVADSAVEVNDRIRDHYMIINGEYFKGDQHEDSTYQDGSKFGEKGQSECFNIGSVLEVCAVARSYFLKDTVLTWQNQKVETVVVISMGKSVFKNAVDATQNKETSVTSQYYFGKDIGLMRYSHVDGGKPELWELQEIKEQQ